MIHVKDDDDEFVRNLIRGCRTEQYYNLKQNRKVYDA